MLSSFRKPAANAEVAIRKARKSTYTEPLRDKSKEYTQQELDDLKDYLSDFYRSIYKRRDECSKICQENPKTVGHFFETLVPRFVTFEDFWQRYFYRCDPDRIIKEWDRQAVSQKQQLDQKIHDSVQSAQKFWTSTVGTAKPEPLSMEQKVKPVVDEDAEDAEQPDPSSADSFGKNLVGASVLKSAIDDFPPSNLKVLGDATVPDLSHDSPQPGTSQKGGDYGLDENVESDTSQRLGVIASHDELFVDSDPKSYEVSRIFDVSIDEKSSEVFEEATKDCENKEPMAVDSMLAGVGDIDDIAKSDSQAHSVRDEEGLLVDEAPQKILEISPQANRRSDTPTCLVTEVQPDTAQLVEDDDGLTSAGEKKSNQDHEHPSKNSHTLLSFSDPESFVPVEGYTVMHPELPASVNEINVEGGNAHTMTLPCRLSEIPSVKSETELKIEEVAMKSNLPTQEPITVLSPADKVETPTTDTPSTEDSATPAGDDNVLEELFSVHNDVAELPSNQETISIELGTPLQDLTPNTYPTDTDDKRDCQYDVQHKANAMLDITKKEKADSQKNLLMKLPVQESSDNDKQATGDRSLTEFAHDDQAKVLPHCIEPKATVPTTGTALNSATEPVKKSIHVPVATPIGARKELENMRQLGGGSSVKDLKAFWNRNEKIVSPEAAAKIATSPGTVKKLISSPGLSKIQLRLAVVPDKQKLPPTNLLESQTSATKSTTIAASEPENQVMMGVGAQVESAREMTLTEDVKEQIDAGIQTREILNTKVRTKRFLASIIFIGLLAVGAAAAVWVQQDFLCAPAMGELTESRYEAPFWATPEWKTTAFDVLCGPKREKMTLQWIKTKRGLFTLLVEERESVIVKRDRLISATVSSEHIFATNKKGEVETIQSPWAKGATMI